MFLLAEIQCKQVRQVQIAEALDQAKNLVEYASLCLSPHLACCSLSLSGVSRPRPWVATLARSLPRLLYSTV